MSIDFHGLPRDEWERRFHARVAERAVDESGKKLTPKAAAEISAEEIEVAEALQNMGDFWAYGMAKAEGARPTAEDDAAVHAISAGARMALDTYLEFRSSQRWAS